MKRQQQRASKRKAAAPGADAGTAAARESVTLFACLRGDTHRQVVRYGFLYGRSPHGRLD